MKKLKQYIHSLTEFSRESWELLLPALTEKEFKKGELLLEEGKVCKSLFYINEGYCRSYYIKEGVEKNTAFYFEDEIVTNIQSFGSGEASTYAIIACEPVNAIVFDKNKLMEASRKNHEIEALGRNCIRLFSTRQQEFASIFQLYNPEERLLFIEKNHPEILQRVSLTQLASFLGVARETLSRIRKRRVT